MEAGFADRRMLIVEDNFHIAVAMAELLEPQGAEVAGPVATVSNAAGSDLQCRTHRRAALYINLRSELVYPVADALAACACQWSLSRATTGD